MARFLFLLRDSQPWPGGPERPWPESGVGVFTQWMSELALSGNYLWGEALGRSGRYVESQGIVKKHKTSDNVVGCFLIQAENVDQAGAIAQDCPAVLKGVVDIEVRPVIDVTYE